MKKIKSLLLLLIGAFLALIFYMKIGSRPLALKFLAKK